MKRTKRVCVGITVNVAGDKPFGPCTRKAAHGIEYCATCAKRPVRQAMLRLLLVPDWQARQEQGEARPAEPPVKRGPIPTREATETYLQSQRWWERG